MTTVVNGLVTDPDLVDVLASLKEDVFRTLHCVKVGQVQSFDGNKKTAKIQLLFKKTAVDGTVTSYPVLVDCPVFTLQGGSGGIQLPIAAGDQCIVLFSDRNIDTWFSTGSEAAPPSARCHDLSDGIALVGVNAQTSSLSNYVSSKARFFYSGAEIDLAAGLVTIKNATTTLGTLIANLITALEGLQVNGPLPLTAASVATLEAQKILFATLLA